MKTRLAILAMGIAICSAVDARDVWIEDVTIVSPERGQPLRGATVKVHDQRIAEISRHLNPAKRAAGEVIDGRGLYLTPGLIDSHVHLFQIPGMLPDQEQAHPDIARAARAQIPKSYLYFGFTTLVDLIATPRSMAIWNAQPLRPDTYFCGGAPIPGGYPSNFFPPAMRYEFFPYFLVEPGQAEAVPPGTDPAEHTPEAVVARMKADGAICVKTFFEHGFGANRNLPVPQLATVRALVRAAHRAGLPVLMHANSADAQIFGLDAGVDIFAHGLWNWGDTPPGADLTPAIRKILQGVLDHRRGWQPTIEVLYGERNVFDDQYLANPLLAKAYPKSLIEWYQSAEGQWYHDQFAKRMGNGPIKPEDVDGVEIARINSAVKFMAQHNARFLFGSDTPSDETFANPPGFNGWLEMQRLIDAGLTPAQLFKAATLSNAEALGLAELGTVQVGKRANLLLLHDDPTQTIRAYEQIDRVILRGRVLDPAALAADAPPH